MGDTANIHRFCGFIQCVGYKRIEIVSKQIDIDVSELDVNGLPHGHRILKLLIAEYARSLKISNIIIQTQVLFSGYYDTGGFSGYTFRTTWSYEQIDVAL